MQSAIYCRSLTTNFEILVLFGERVLVAPHAQRSEFKICFVLVAQASISYAPTFLWMKLEMLFTLCPLFASSMLHPADGRLAVVQYLLEAGANPDGVPAEAGGCGATPLHR